MKNNGRVSFGNCDTFLYLGGNEQSTHKYVSELLGKETIDTNTFGKSTGHSGSYSTNYQQTGRELLTPDEVRLLDNNYALLFIRGERAIKDYKYDILKHPNVKLTTDGKGENYEHGKADKVITSIEVMRERKTKDKKEIINIENRYIVLTSYQIEKYLREEKENEERKLEKSKNKEGEIEYEENEE